MTADHREQTNYADGYRRSDPYDHESSTLIDEREFVDAGVTKNIEQTDLIVSDGVNHK